MILGATLYGKQSEELINIIKLAIDQNIPYTVLRDNILHASYDGRII